MKGLVSIFLIALLTMLPGQLMADVTPSISIELSGRASYRDIEGIPSAEGGAMLEVRPGMEFGAGWGLSFPVYAGVAKELLPMHPFLSIPAVTTVGAGIAGEYSIGRWILTLSETIEYSMLNGNAFVSFATSFNPRFMLIQMEDRPISYAVGLPVTATYGASGFSVQLGISLSMEVGVRAIKEDIYR